MKLDEKAIFTIKNIAKGILVFLVIIIAYVLLKKIVNIDFLKLITEFSANPELVFIIFVLSEFFVGIIPPEIFILWALEKYSLGEYFVIVTLFSIISYIIGIIVFRIGKTVHKVKMYNLFNKRITGRYIIYFNKFGSLLIIIASITPLPYSLICFLVGAVNFSFKRFIYFSLFRFLRFAVYAIVIWQLKGI